MAHAVPATSRKDPRQVHSSYRHHGSSTSWPRKVGAQGATKRPVVAFLSENTAASKAAHLAAFLAGMRDLGYAESSNRGYRRSSRPLFNSQMLTYNLPQPRQKLLLRVHVSLHSEKVELIANHFYWMLSCQQSD